MAEFSDPHQWYFVVRCEECRQFISLGEAPSIDADVEPRFEELHVICPHCEADRCNRPVQPPTVNPTTVNRHDTHKSERSSRWTI